MCFLKEYKKGTLYIKITMPTMDMVLIDFTHIPICFKTLHAKLRFSHIEHMWPEQSWDMCKSINTTEKKKAVTMHISNKTDTLFL